MKISFKRPPSALPAGHVRQTFAVTGLSCGNCAMTVDLAVESLEGVAESSTSFARGETLVVYDPRRVTVDAVVAAIDRAGYRAAPLPSDPTQE